MRAGVARENRRRNALAGRILRWLRELGRPKASFKRLLRQPHVHLYAGDVPADRRYRHCIGMSLSRSNSRHIRHDMTLDLPLPDSCVDVFQSEDVFEHMEPAVLPSVISEIHRVLKPGGIFRLSIPDYRCDILRSRTLQNADGQLVFDPQGGGSYENGKVVGGGHVWFPTYESVKALLDRTAFTDVVFYHYYDSEGEPVTKAIDYSIAHVMRTPDHDERVREPYRPMSIVLDCRK